MLNSEFDFKNESLVNISINTDIKEIESLKSALLLSIQALSEQRGCDWAVQIEGLSNLLEAFSFSPDFFEFHALVSRDSIAEKDTEIARLKELLGVKKAA